MKGQKFPKPTEKHAKSLLFSGFFAVFVSRETDAENQTVPRETYIFHYLKYPSRYRFCARFYSLIVDVLRLKSYVEKRLPHTVLPQIIHIRTPKFRTKSKPFSQHPSRFTAARSTRKNRLTDNISHTFFFRISPTPNTVYCPLRISFRIIHIFKSAENYKSALLLLFRGIVAAFF